MADGMDKAFFLSNDDENVSYAYSKLWDAATVHVGRLDRALGVLPLRTGGFALVSRQGSTYHAWMLSAGGDLRPLEGFQLVRLVSHL